MSTSAPRLHRLPLIITGGATVATVTALLLGGSAAANAAATPHPLTSTQVDAKVASSLVQLETTWSASIGVPLKDGTVSWSTQPESVAFDCTGWFADNTGDIVTAGHCVDPQKRSADLIDAYMDDLAQAGKFGIDAAWVQENREWAHTHWQVKGSAGTTTPDRDITAFQSKNVAHPSLEHATTATLVDFRPISDSDVAMLHVDVAHTIGLPVGFHNPTVGAAVTAVGFPASVSGVSDESTLQPSFKTGTVSSHQDSDGSGKLEINADTSPGMSGGPTIDAHGNVIGIVSYSPADETKDFNFLSDTDAVRSFLTRQNVRFVKPYAGTVDHAAVTRVSDLFNHLAGAAGSVGLLIIGLLVALRRRRPRPTTAAAAPATTVPSPTNLPTIQERIFVAGAAGSAPTTAFARIGRCENGHPNSAEAHFCSTCGMPAQSSERAAA